MQQILLIKPNKITTKYTGNTAIAIVINKNHFHWDSEIHKEINKNKNSVQLANTCNKKLMIKPSPNQNQIHRRYSDYHFHIIINHFHWNSEIHKERKLNKNKNKRSTGEHMQQKLLIKPCQNPNQLHRKYSDYHYH